MINLTLHNVVFNKSGKELSSDVRAALQTAASASLRMHGHEGLNLDLVTTKSYLQAAFAKFVSRRVLTAKAAKFEEAYVNAAIDAYRQKTGQVSEEQFSRVMRPQTDGALSYKASYAVAIKPGLGLFLLALHSRGAITLPASFTWPSVREVNGSARRREVGGLVCSELLRFIRTLDSQADEIPHRAFEAVGGDRKRKEWFLTYATKLLLATGWHSPEDVNLVDLLAIKAAEKAISPKETLPLAYKALLDVLKLAFGNRVAVTSEEWAEALRGQLGRVSRPPMPKALRKSEGEGPRSDRELLDELLEIDPAWGLPERLKTLTRLPGLEVDLSTLTALWLQLEELYVEKTARENYRPIWGALGYWNIYLFCYLPYWFARNPNTSLKFPATPALLTTSVFVSRLLPLREAEVPITFIEFMDAHSEHRGWTGNSYYGLLRQLKKFFAFVEQYSDELPDCAGFRQPLGDHDDPPTSRPKSTRKQPVPRRFFGVYLDYHEALLAHHRVVSERVLEGLLTPSQRQTIEAHRDVIDTFGTANIVGFIPLLFTPSKTIPLQFIPNVLNFSVRRLKDGRVVELPSPHSLHQNLVALHTGVRHNHLQWLDRDRFDEEVDDDASDFALLFVNTDKKKLEPWTPHVNMRVIDLLRAQRQWAELIDEPGFNTKHFYNNNKKTKWPKFRPLFAHKKDGRPHGDNDYTDVWQRVLCGLQGLTSELLEFGRLKPLLRLLPPNMRAKDPDLSRKLGEYGSQFGAGQFCPLNVMSDTTPHSARVAVVSQYFTFLPTDLIGKYITGQAPGVVPYYVHLEKDMLEIEQVNQARRLRDMALRTAFEPVLSGTSSGTAFIHADNVNSNLARSLRANFDETLVSYGCISISFTENGVKGIDVLRETRGENASANKTEICPYGNNCPPEIVKLLRGLHRCSLCPYAVRSVDHLPAIVAKKRQLAETLDSLEQRLSDDAKTLNAKYTPNELDRLDEERARMAEELTGWVLNEEVLELTRQRIARGQDLRRWVVQKPEIIEQDLTRVVVPTSMTAYVLGRLGECVAYPTLDSPQIRARFDLLRRELLARAGNLRAAFSDGVPIDPAAECAGLLRSIVSANGINATQLAELLEHDHHLQLLPQSTLRLLGHEGELS